MPRDLLTFNMKILFLALLPAMLLIAGCQQQPEIIRLGGDTMGTTWSVTVVHDRQQVSNGDLQTLLENRLVQINQLMSTYDPQSEVSRFNKKQSDSWFPISVETYLVIRQALQISELSGGAFDISVGPLVNLWGFGTTGRPQQRPTQEEIRSILASVGYQHLELRAHPPLLKKDIPALQIDLSAIAKGYAVDALGNVLQQQGYQDFLVEIGGEILTAGRRPGKQLWRIAVEKPVEETREVGTILTMTGTAMATSGNYRNFYVEDGQRYVHTIDPVSGQPIIHKLASATVLDPSCARADALATTLMVMGEEKAIAFSEKHDIPVYLMIHHGEETANYQSPAFKKFLQEQQP